MRFLADAGISPKTLEYLRALGHDAVHVRELALERANDRTIIARAEAERRIVLTFDLDFGEIMALGVKLQPSVVIFRLRDETANAVNQRLGVLLNERREALEHGALALVEDERYRLRNLPIRAPE